LNQYKLFGTNETTHLYRARYPIQM
jgi:hypothetical protein